MKKIISLLLSMLVVLEALCVPVFAEEDTVSEYMQTMREFGVISEEKYETGTFTVATMSEMVYKLLNPGSTEPEATRQIYTDVDRWHWAAGYIEWLYNNSVYTGDGSGALQPERNAKLSDVCTVMLNLLGYQKVMDYTNDNTDVIKKATEIKLLSSKVGKNEHDITYGEFASVCYELLFTKVIEAKFSDDGGFAQGGEFINEILEIEYELGIVTAANGYSLTYANCNTDEVIIDGNKLDACGKSYIDYLGYNVRYYYNDDAELIAAVPIKNTELVIKSEDIISYENNRYNYEDGTKTKRADVSADVMLLYNGKVSTNRDAFLPSYGQVRLIDNDRDSKYDCIISENAYNVVVNVISDGIIYGKNTEKSGNKYVIDTKDFELLRVVSKDAEISIADVEAGSIITAVISEDEEYALLYVSDKKVTGVLTAYTTDEEIAVDGEEYNRAKDMFNPYSLVATGNDVTMLLDEYGNIAAILGNYENKYLLGYLISFKINEEDDTLVLKLLTSDNQIKKISTAEKLYVDGVKKENVYAAEECLTAGELIKYRVSGGEIKNIDTATQQAGFGSFTATSDKNSLRMIANGKMLYKSTPQVFKKYTSSMSMYSEFGVSDDTPIFFVPTEDEYKDDSDYYVASRTSLRNDLTADVQGYVTGKLTLIADAVVVNYKTELNLSSGIMIVGSISETLNADDEIVYSLKGMKNGEDIEVLATDNDKGVTNGSFIRYQTNRDGEAKDIDPLYRPEGGGRLQTTAAHEYAVGSSYARNANIRFVLGSIYDREGTVVRFRFKDSVADDEVFNLKNCNFYVYDKAENTLRSGSIDDIYDIVHYGTSCDEVIITTRAASTSDVIIVRK